MQNTSTVDAVVTNPCFELWLLWHATDLHGYTEVHKCAKLTHTHKLTKNKELTRDFPIIDYPKATKRALQAWPNLAPNKIGPNPSSAMPWLIDLMTTPSESN